LALRNRLKASWTSAAVQGFGAFGLTDFFAVAVTGFFAAFFGTDGTAGLAEGLAAGFLAPTERMILAMIGIY